MCLVWHREGAVRLPRKEMKELDLLMFQGKLEIYFLRENFCFLDDAN